MIVRLKDRLLVITVETDEERPEFAAWASESGGHVFHLIQNGAQTVALHDLGPREQACREPVNVIFHSPDPSVRLISNLAHTPFELNGERYQSVEAFWQGLKFPGQSDRRRVAKLHGKEAREAAEGVVEADTFDYQGKPIRRGAWDHWQLMRQACEAKFSQHEEARIALFLTGERPLAHRVKHDSRNIPGVIMAEIWMRIRAGLANAETPY